jgi:hypothetical protein
VQAPVDGAPGGPRGMAGAVESRNEEAWMRANDSPWRHSSEAPHAYSYTQSSTSRNYALRNGQPDGSTRGLSQELADRRLQSDMYLNRLTYLPQSTWPGGDISNLVGAVFKDKAFMSTATTAERKMSWSGDMLFRIRANAGTRAAWVDNISHFKGEREVIIDAGQHFYVHSVRRVTPEDRIALGLGSEQTWIVEVETVDPGWVRSQGQRVWDSNTSSWTDPG